MKAILGLLLLVLGVVLGLYVGFWLCFIGGIVQIIHSLQANPIQAYGVAIGVVRVFGASLAGWLSLMACWLPGLGLLKSSL